MAKIVIMRFPACTSEGFFIPDNFHWTCCKFDTFGIDMENPEAIEMQKRLWESLGHTVVDVSDEAEQELLKLSQQSIRFQIELNILFNKEKRYGN